MLNRLADAAEKQPVLCLVDDAQWLDRATAQTLAFIARRLDAEAVGIVFAVRKSIEHFDGLSELVLSGLAPQHARELLAAASAGPADQAVRERFITETHGNPLALLELSRGLTAADFEVAFNPRDSRGLWVRLEESFQRRVEGLSAEARMLLLIAAAEPVGDPVLFWRAADLLGVPRDAAGSLDESGLLRVGARVEFRHPLVRSAVLPICGARCTPLGTRRPGRGDRSRARSRPARLASRARSTRVLTSRSRSSWSSLPTARRHEADMPLEAAFAERALTLTADFGQRGVRALAAARARLAAGEPRPARDLLSVAEKGTARQARFRAA